MQIFFDFVWPALRRLKHELETDSFLISEFQPTDCIEFNIEIRPPSVSDSDDPGKEMPKSICNNRMISRNFRQICSMFTVI